MAVFRTIPAGDLELSGGNFVWLGDTDATRVQLIRQKLAARFKFFLGEWFLDLREGIPYYRDVLVKNPNLDVVRSLFLRVVRTTPGVLDVPVFSLVYNRQERSIAFSFQAVVDGGELTITPEDADFVVDLAPAA